jgi:hypothetical protein
LDVALQKIVPTSVELQRCHDTLYENALLHL